MVAIEAFLTEAAGGMVGDCVYEECDGDRRVGDEAAEKNSRVEERSEKSNSVLRHGRSRVGRDVSGQSGR